MPALRSQWKAQSLALDLQCSEVATSQRAKSGFFKLQEGLSSRCWWKLTGGSVQYSDFGNQFVVHHRLAKNEFANCARLIALFAAFELNQIL